MPRLKTSCLCGSRRLPSFGSVDYRPKSDTHQVRYRVDGQYQPSKSFDTHDEAVDFLEQLAIDARKGKPMPNRRKGQTTFEVIAEEWLTAALKTTQSPSTANKYRAAKAWAVKGFKGRAIAEVTRDEVQDFYNEECLDPADSCAICEELRYDRGDDEARCRKHQAKPKAVSTVATYRVYFHQIWDRAVYNGYLPNGSPASSKLQRLPSGTRRMVCLDREETDYLLGVTKAQFSAPDFRLVHVAAHTAMRQGELLGLGRWNVRIREGQDPYILVEDSLRVDGRIKSTKTENTRMVDLFPCCVEILREQLNSHDHRLVFPSETGRPQDANNWRKRVWYRIVEAAGFQGPKASMHFHDLRHTHISQLLAEGMPVADVAERAGHANPKVTLGIYTHAIPGNQRRHIQRLASSFGGDPGGAQVLPLDRERRGA